MRYFPPAVRPVVLCLVLGTGASTFAGCSTNREAVSIQILPHNPVGTGVGNVRSGHAHANIDCTINMGTLSGACFDDFNDLDGQQFLNLTATPGPGSSFVAWGGCPSSVGNVCMIDVTQQDAYVIAAQFDSP